MRERAPAELRREIGYVIQQIGLFPTARSRTTSPTVPRLLGWDRDRIDARVNELLDVIGLEPELMRRFPRSSPADNSSEPALLAHSPRTRA